MTTRANLTIASTLFIGAFIAWQMAVPASYYASDEHSAERFDERFSWRMFSPTRLAHCSVSIGPMDPKTENIRRIRALREIHPVWNNLLKRGRPAVIEEVMAHFCAISQDDARLADFTERQGFRQADALDFTDLRMSISCQRPDFARRGICINPADLDGDGMPDGYQSKGGCYAGKKRMIQDDFYTKRNCFERECGVRSALECFQEVCPMRSDAEESEMCEGFEDSDKDGILDHLVTASCSADCARERQDLECGSLKPHLCFLKMCALSPVGMPGICVDAYDRDRDGVPDGYNDPRFSPNGDHREQYKSDCAAHWNPPECESPLDSPDRPENCRLPRQVRDDCQLHLCKTVIADKVPVCEGAP